MQIGHRLPRCRRLRHRIAAARLVTDRRSRAIVGTNSRELGDPRKHRWRRLIGKVPILGRGPKATYQHDRRVPYAATLQIHLAAAAAGSSVLTRGTKSKKTRTPRDVVPPVS